MSRRVVSLCIVVLLGALTGIVSAGAQAPEDPVRLAVYAAETSSPGATSAVVTTLTKYRLLSDSVPTVTKAASGAVLSADKGSSGVVTAAVELIKPGQGDVVQMKDYPLNLLPAGVSAKYCLSLEVINGITTPKGVQKFNPSLVIVLSVPDGTKPFVLNQDKRGVTYLDSGKLPDGFDGKVARNGSVYTIIINSWPAGDPCIGG